MDIFFLVYVVCLMVTFIGSVVYHRSQINFLREVGELIDEKATVKMVTKINTNHREVMLLSLIPIVNTITAIVMLLGAIKELLDGVDEVIIKIVDIWRRFKIWVRR